LYVHLPWCVRKCPYCDFNSHAAGADVDRDAYVTALLADLDGELARHPGRELVSVFIGGGTPSLFDAAEIARLLDGIDCRIGLPEGTEITLEANPGTVEAGRFAGYRAAGVNRLSIGVQSLDDAKLRALGRIHDAAEAIAAVAVARGAGFDNINIDLMFALPGQTQGEAMSELRSALELMPEHLSWYQLTLEPNTPFFQQPPAGLPDQDLAADIADEGRERLRSAGFRQYEVSAYARAGRECRHNRNYWEFGDYLGIGAGAHGKLTHPDGRVERRAKRRSPGAYMADASSGAVSSSRTVSTEELPLEFMLNALRLNDGVPAHWFVERTGLPQEAIADVLATARSRGLMGSSPADRLAPTPLGQQFLNDLLALFEPEAKA
jgi:oxygen-independent coproporphyrinogen-3 oxidase